MSLVEVSAAPDFKLTREEAGTVLVGVWDAATAQLLATGPRFVRALQYVVHTMYMDAACTQHMAVRTTWRVQ